MADLPKTYWVGNGRDFETEYGTKTVLDICLSDIPKEFMKTDTKTGKHYIKLIVQTKTQPDKFQNTKSVKVDTYKKP